MNTTAAIQVLKWIRTAWREPMLVCLGVSGAVHAGVFAYAMTREPLREQIHNAGGTVTIEVVVIEGPEQHPGTQSGDDRERAAASAAAGTESAPPQVDPAQQTPRAVQMDAMAAAAATKLVGQDFAADRSDSVPQRDVTSAVRPSAARLVAAPQPGREAVAATVTPVPLPAPPPAALLSAPVRHAAQPVPIPPPKPRPPEATTEQRPAPAVAGPEEDATRPRATARLTAEQSESPEPLAEKGTDSAPGAHAGGTRGAAPLGDNPKPAYPFGARRRGEEGRVVLRVMVMPSGDAATVDVAESSGYDRLDKAARETVRRWRFVPARRGGTPVAAEVTVPIRFQLR